MPKVKTKKGVAKRFRFSGKNKIKRPRAGRGHLLTSKNAKRRRSLGTKAGVTASESKSIKRMMPYN